MATGQLTGQKMETQVLTGQAVKQLAALVPMSLVAGGGLRGLVGLYHMLTSSGKEENPSAYAPLSVNIPPARQKKAYDPILDKHADEGEEEKKRATKKNKPNPTWWQTTAPIAGAAIGAGLLGPIVYENFVKKAASSTADLGWPVPVMAGVGTAGLYGGWKGVDWLLKQRKQKELQEEVDKAKQEYEAALLSKTGSELGRDLDRLYDVVQQVKEAGWTSGDKTPSPGELAALYGIYALVSGGLGFKGGYNWVTSRSRSEAAENARQQQIARLAANKPPVFYAIPDATASRKRFEEENEENITAGSGTGMPSGAGLI